MEDEHGASTDREPLHQLAQAEVRDAGRRSRQQVGEVIAKPAGATVPGDALAQRDGRQPTVERVEVSKLVDRATSLEIGVMNGILGRLAGDGSADADEPRPQLLELLVQHVEALSPIDGARCIAEGTLESSHVALQWPDARRVLHLAAVPASAALLNECAPIQDRAAHPAR